MSGSDCQAGWIDPRVHPHGQTLSTIPRPEVG